MDEKRNPIRPVPLREEVRAALLEQLIDGSIPPGSRLRDQEIARALDVSRTPVREALASLSEEGLVTAIPNRGYRAPRLLPRIPGEVYPLIWTLETFALSEIREPEARRIGELRSVNRDLAGEPSLRRRLELDDDWHSLLLKDYENEYLHSIVRRLKLQVRSYEAAFLRDAGRTALSISDHERVTAALEQGDVGRATAALRDNWAFTLRTILTWLTADA